MKHFRILLPLLILALILSGCGKQVQEPYTYTFHTNSGEKTVTVYPESRQIVDGLDVYTYNVVYSANNTQIDIRYPDGESYWWTVTRAGGVGGWSAGYDESRYISGSVLIDALQEEQPREKVGNFGLGFFLIILGLVDFFFPEALFHLRRGWMFKNAEPSETYLWLTKIGGAILAVLGLILCII